ncbi:MAG TPA: acyl-CoA desaturase [Chitinophagaceae bacterium]|nr:acyl-CoA desaturase [Chitinophagaceae bacterium]
MAFIIVFFISHWYLSLFSQTFFQHRYAAHGAFTMNRFWERVFFVVAYVTQGSSYMSPRAYGIMHRMHHAYADTEKDPHSPAYDRNIFAMMWRTRVVYLNILERKIPIEPRFTKNLPEWNWFDKWGNSWLSRLLWVGVYVFLYVLFAPSLWFYFLLPLHAAMGPVHGVIINWFAHKYGHVEYPADNSSKNMFNVDFLMLGEAYHNNHHAFPSRANFATRKGDFDFCFLIIRALHKLKVIRLRDERQRSRVKRGRFSGVRSMEQ